MTAGLPAIQRRMPGVVDFESLGSLRKESTKTSSIS
jgi:hypothetical protein